MLAVIVEFEIKPEHVETCRQAILRQAATSLELEPACQRFDVCLDPDDPSRVFLYELYDDRTAFDLHLGTPHFRSFNLAISPWVANKQVRLLHVAMHEATSIFPTSETP